MHDGSLVNGGIRKSHVNVLFGKLVQVVRQ